MHLKRLLREFPCMPPLYTDSELVERLLSESSELCAMQRAVLDGFIVLPERFVFRFKYAYQRVTAN